jgi:hypothetical protein
MRKIRIELYWLKDYILLGSAAGTREAAGARGHLTFGGNMKYPA